LIASSNPGKLRDFLGAAALYDVQPELISGFEQLPQAVEDGKSFAENARKKSEHYSRYVSGKLVLADDSGLEVDALDGAPGVHSARYAALHHEGLRPADYGDAKDAPAGMSSQDAANNACLLRELAQVNEDRRQARFVCVISVARDGIELASFRGEAHGVLLHEARGSNGFGYDPLFFFPPLSKTFAELTPGQKAAVSHRGQALRAFLNWVQTGAGK
jgi:XTP/dITP diphosphohydrolase